MRRPVIIGLTGNIATGKSAIMRLAAERGALTIDADRVVHELLANDAAIQSAVTREFGAAIQRPGGGIDRPALGRIVFGDAARLRQLEALLHPAVRQEIARRVSEASTPVVMIEAIKLLEGPLATLCDQIWVTTCSRATQLERLRVCRGMSIEDAITRIDAQSPQEDRIARADVVIQTDGLMVDTQRQFEVAWTSLPQPE